jgi:hypothetical protein
MKKEKSKIFFNILIASASLALIFCMVFQTFAKNYQDKLNYSTIHFFMRLVSANAEMELTNATIIKALVRDSVLSRADIQSEPRRYAEADAYFRNVCGNTNTLASSLKRSTSYQEGMLRFAKDMESLSARENIFSSLSDVALVISLVLNTIAISYGLQIHDLYKT